MMKQNTTSVAPNAANANIHNSQTTQETSKHLFGASKHQQPTGAQSPISMTMTSNEGAVKAGGVSKVGDVSLMMGGELSSIKEDAGG